MQKRGDNVVTLQTVDGLNITIRQNIIDARIVRETFFQKPYLKYFLGPSKPVIVEIGAYIGDFSMYAAHYLGAFVIAYEPIVENFALLNENIEDNDLGEQIQSMKKALANAKTVDLNVEKDRGEIHVSAYWYDDADHRQVEAVTLEEVFSTHKLDRVDLLKLDCEGCEYDVLHAAPAELFDHIGQIVLEWHEIENWENRFLEIKKKLESAGYATIKEGQILYALRR